MLPSWCVVILFVVSATAAVFGSGAPEPETPDIDVVRTRYDNYKLFDVTPSSAEHVRLLDELWRTSDSHLCLQTGRRAGDPWLLVVAPHKLPEFEETLRRAGVPFERREDDLQSIIDAEALQSVRSTTFDWTAYQSLDRIYAWLDQLAIDHSEHVTPINIGHSFEGRPIRGVRLSFAPAESPTTRRKLPVVFIEGGIHAREWIAPAFVTYLINELLTSPNASVRWAAESHDWHIVPSVNPDGYVHTHRGDRLWRKTRQPHGSFWCRGADPNRNWDFHWNEHSTSPLPCSDIYAGPRPFSEPEMHAYAEYLKGLGGDLQTVVAFHAYSQLLLYPFGHTGEAAQNRDDLQSIGDAAALALRQRHGTRYRVGAIYDTIYPASGASVDWAYGVQKVPLAFTYELRPSDRGRRGFELPADQIVPVGEETVDSLVALLRRAKELGYNREQTVVEPVVATTGGAGGGANVVDESNKKQKPCGVVKLF